MKKKQMLVLFGVFTLVINSEVNAELLPFFGGKSGWQFADDNTYNSSDPNDYIFGVYGGFQITPYLGWDLGYQDQGDLRADKTNVTVKTSLIESSLRYDWLWNDVTGLYGRLGYVYWDMRKTKPSSLSLKDNGFSPLVEFGVKQKLNSNMSLNVGYQYIDGIGSSETGKYDSHSIIASLSYQFGKGRIDEPLKLSVESYTVKPQVFEVKKFQSIFFGFDEYQFVNLVIPELDDVIYFLNRYPETKIEVSGYTDPKGSTKYNKELSIRRAKSVADYLSIKGIDKSRMIIRGKGEVYLSKDYSIESYAKSRRVDVRALESKSEVQK
ncbi:OmpA family protein [Vibrio scophthalmi]|uniref:OmpA family protein n=1 Tax=Vibrio scophthalmi TaxID=45658 RepID=UPI003AACFB8B